MGAVFGAILCAFLYLGTALHRVQVVDSRAYSDALDRHSIRRVRLPSTRGRILDRNGVALADNRPSYCVALYVEELRQRGAWSNTIHAVSRLVDELSVVIGLPREIDLEDISAHITRRRPLPLLAWKGLDDVALARLAECPRALPGVDIYVMPERIYPLGDCAAHVIGYVGKGNPESHEHEVEEDYDFYLPDLKGRHGIEIRYDAHLSGSPGGQLIRVDAVGYKHEARTGRMPVAGQDIALTLDVRWQQVAEQALQGLRGAVVVIDSTNGEIVVMASSPRYDLSDFVPFMPTAVWARLSSSPGHPMLHRATSGIYAPGSIFKPVVALAALDEGLVHAQSRIHCSGQFVLPNSRPLRCWNRLGHGDIAMQEAMEQSCNVYFCEIGVQLGYEPRIREDSLRLGLGQRPGIEIPASAALLPSDAWKRRTWKDGWRQGDTANLSIGQGFLSATPLQMAVMTAAIANGGNVLRPNLVRAPAPGPESAVVVQRMGWKPRSLDVVRRGMYDAVQAPHGTGRKAAIEGISIGGKTGTAEYYDRGERLKHAWMAAFGPYEQPRYAMAVIVENSDSGGRSAAPIVHRVFSALFDREPDPSVVPEVLPDDVGGQQDEAEEDAESTDGTLLLEARHRRRMDTGEGSA